MTKDTKSKSDSVDDLLFSGLLYHIINEPEDIRNTSLPFDIIQSNNSLDKKTKIESIETAIRTVDRIKDRDWAYSALEAFLEDSRYNLIFVNNDFHHIYHNQKSDKIVDYLFDIKKPKKIKTKFIKLISNAKKEHRDDNQRLITIPKAINNSLSLYLISNKHKLDEERDINILLIPNFEDHKFQLQDALIRQYRFTKKETLILTNLITGFDLQQISERANISVNTVRTHLKSIYRKTKTKSQSSLIRLFLNHESQYLDSYFETKKLKPHLDTQAESSDLFVTLNTGNKICYRDYGPKDGRPLVVFHNLLGSRFNTPYQYSEILEKTNRRIIIPEKPGYGLSDVVPKYSLQWNNMFDEFMNKLEISKFALLGNVSGSASALRYAACYPDRLNSITLASPLFFNQPGQHKLLGELPYTASRMVRLSERMATNTYRFWMKSLKLDTEKNIKRMVKHYAGSNEIDMLQNQDFIDHLVLNFTESQHNNSHGSGEDATYSLTPLKLDLTKITVPVEIWIGNEDSLITVSSAKEICDPIPNKTFHVRKGYGEEIYYHLFEEIIQ